MPREGGEDQMSAVSATMEEVELARRARVVRALLEWPPTLTVWWSAGGRLRAFELADALGEASYELVETHDASGRLELCGWRQRARVQPADEAAGRMVSAAEPYAELTPHGREQWVIEATESLADEVAGDGARGRRAAERLRRELREGTELRRVGLRGVQRALVSELARGHTAGELCVRGGFVSNGQPDATGLMRAAGLRDRPVRTTSYETALALARAAGPEPWEVSL